MVAGTLTGPRRQMFAVAGPQGLGAMAVRPRLELGDPPRHQVTSLMADVGRRGHSIREQIAKRVVIDR